MLFRDGATCSSVGGTAPRDRVECQAVARLMGGAAGVNWNTTGVSGLIVSSEAKGLTRPEGCYAADCNAAPPYDCKSVHYNDDAATGVGSMSSGGFYVICTMPAGVALETTATAARPLNTLALIGAPTTQVAIVLFVLAVIACRYHNVFKKKICGREPSTRDCQDGSYVSMPTDTLQEHILRNGVTRAAYQAPRP
jgi:hypothetical protein